MDKHVCKQCQKIYSYCRGCLLSPISYKESGYCSERCYEASKNKRADNQCDNDADIAENCEDASM